MKKIRLGLLLTLAQLLFSTVMVAQAPEKMSYQAVVRNAENELVVDAGVGMQISLLKDGAAGTAVYVERHFPTTNSNGLIHIEIGTGTTISGDFAAIDWANGTYFVKTETDINGGASYTITGTSQLLTVPYALHAKTVEEKQTLAINGNKLSISDGNEVTLPSGGTGTATGGKTYLVLAGDITNEEAIEKMQADLGANTQFVKVIGTSGLTTLDFSGYDLKNLVEVSLTDNASLQSVVFPDLVNVWDDLYVTDNSSLSTLSFPALDLCGSEIYVSSNSSLGNFELPKLTKVSYLNIQSNDVLASVDLPLLNKAGVSIARNSNLSTVTLSSLVTARSLYFEENNISSLNLSQLTEGTGYMRISEESLSSINLNSLAKLSSLSIEAKMLGALELPSLVSTEGSISVSSEVMTSISYPSLVRVGEMSLPSSLTSLNLPALLDMGSFSLHADNLSYLNLSSVKTMKGLNISNNKMTQLSFPSLETIEAYADGGYGSMYISSESITSLDFPKLKTVSSMSLYCSALTNMDFSVLTTNNGSLDIQSEALTSLDFPLLETLSGSLPSFYLPLVTNVSFPKLMEIEYISLGERVQTADFRDLITITGSFYYYGSSTNDLATLDLGRLETVGSLSISSSSLTSLDLSSLVTVTNSNFNTNNPLSISSNSNLTSVDLSSLASVNGGLSLYYNALTSLTLGSAMQFSNYDSFNFNYNNLSSAALNSILSSFVDSNVSEGSLYLQSQQSSALPTGQGLIDEQTLIDRGVEVLTGN